MVSCGVIGIGPDDDGLLTADPIEDAAGLLCVSRTDHEKPQIVMLAFLLALDRNLNE